jgi:predicted DNA-binding transcriptional regulator AlpA
MQKLFFTIEEVALLLVLSEATVRHWSYGHRPPPKGFPRPIRIGRQLRYVAADLDAWISGICTAEATVAPEETAKKRGRPRKVKSALGEHLHGAN